MKVILVIVTIFFLTGCSVRTYTVEKQRVDTQLEGNQGYLSGIPPSDAGKGKSRLGSTRKMSVMEVEFGSYSRKKEGKNIIKAEYIPKKKKEPVQEAEIEQEQEEVVIVEEETYPEVVEVGDNYQWYTVKKNDTLQKISYKFYDTTKKWLLIFEQNEDILNSPDKIYPGARIKIPVLDSEQKYGKNN